MPCSPPVLLPLSMVAHWPVYGPHNDHFSLTISNNCEVSSILVQAQGFWFYLATFCIIHVILVFLTFPQCPPFKQQLLLLPPLHSWS